MRICKLIDPFSIIESHPASRLLHYKGAALQSSLSFLPYLDHNVLPTERLQHKVPYDDTADS